MSQFGLLGVIDALWNLDARWKHWGDVCVAAMLAETPRGLTGIGWQTDLRAGSVNAPPVGDESLFDFLAAGYDGAMPAEDMDTLHAVGTVATSPYELFANPELPTFLDTEYRARGFNDALMLTATLPSGTFVNFAVFLGSRRDPTRRRRLIRRWQAITHSMQAALELREHLATREPSVIADFDERGHGDYRHPEQRVQMLEQALRQEWERNQGRIPTATWSSLLSGRYSIVRYRSHGGRLRFLAIENPESCVGLRALDARERDVVARLCRGESNKRIGLELGVHPASVPKILARCLLKLGVRDRRQLLALARAFGVPSDRVVEYAGEMIAGN